MTPGRGESLANLASHTVAEGDVRHKRGVAVVEVHQVSKIYTQHVARGLLGSALWLCSAVRQAHPFYALRGFRFV
jgi:hypothetical protein